MRPVPNRPGLAGVRTVRGASVVVSDTPVLAAPVRRSFRHSSASSIPPKHAFEPVKRFIGVAHPRD
jgi:hypothetical protein